jgi:50S ribosomal subunit-associated GTPase HflX
VSARSGAGFGELLQAIDDALPLDPVSRQRFHIPAAEGSLIHLLHERAKVLSSQYQGDVLEVEAEVPESVKRRLSGYLAE